MDNILSIKRFLRLYVARRSKDVLIVRSVLSEGNVKLVGIEYLVNHKLQSVIVYLSEFKFGIMERVDIESFLGFHINFHLQRILHILSVHYGVDYQHSSEVRYGDRFIADLNEIKQGHYYLLFNKPYVIHREMGNVVYIRELDEMGIESVNKSSRNLEQFTEKCPIKTYTPG